MYLEVPLRVLQGQYLLVLYLQEYGLVGPGEGDLALGHVGDLHGVVGQRADHQLERHHGVARQLCRRGFLGDPCVYGLLEGHGVGIGRGQCVCGVPGLGQGLRSVVCHRGPVLPVEDVGVGQGEVEEGEPVPGIGVVVLPVAVDVPGVTVADQQVRGLFVGRGGGHDPYGEHGVHVAVAVEDPYGQWLRVLYVLVGGRVRYGVPVGQVRRRGVEGQGIGEVAPRDVPRGLGKVEGGRQQRPLEALLALGDSEGPLPEHGQRAHGELEWRYPGAPRRAVPDPCPYGLPRAGEGRCRVYGVLRHLRVGQGGVVAHGKIGRGLVVPDGGAVVEGQVEDGGAVIVVVAGGKVPEALPGR